MLSLLESNELADESSALAQLFLSEAVVAVHGQPFVLREESPPATLGGGLVIQPRGVDGSTAVMPRRSRGCGG